MTKDRWTKRDNIEDRIKSLAEENATLREVIQLRDQRELNEFHRRINGELNEELEAEKEKRKCLCDDDK
jgi:predicted nuclease with TOPRIM domain